MCGIAGIYHRDSAAVRLDQLEKMAKTMLHRGPDDDGYFVSGPIGLGHRRLSIIDVAGGRQPIFNEDGSIGIVLNGEIYNHASLRKELVGKGHTFKTQSDTEAIVHAYEEWGDSFVERLTGMFGFGLWDGAQRKLVLCRDRLGIKPLYYTLQRDRLVFASEVKAILTLEGVDRRVDLDALDAFLSLRYVPGPRTLFKGIFKLQPGQILTAQSGEVAFRTYWDLEFGEDARDESEASKELEALLFDVCESHLMSEVPYGVFLSGGIDSSAVTHVLRSLLKSDVATFTVGYTGADRVNEFEYARRARSRSVDLHHELELSATDFERWIPELVWHLDEPVGDPACIPLYFLARYAKERATVLHSGEGADEILAGYGIYRKMQTMSALQSGVFSPASRAVGRLLGGRNGRGKLSQYAELIDKPLEERYRGVSGHFMKGFRRALLRESTLSDGKFVAGTFEAYYDRVRGQKDLNRMLYVDTKTWLPEDLLVKADKMTMAASVELRVPFLDHRLVEFAARLPVRYKLRRGETKYLLKRVMEPHLPREVVYRQKKGFPVPIADWFRNGLHDEARETLLDPQNSIGRFLNLSTVGDMLALHKGGRLDLANELWGLLILEHWFREFKVAA